MRMEVIKVSEGGSGGGGEVVAPPCYLVSVGLPWAEEGIGNT